MQGSRDGGAVDEKSIRRVGQQRRYRRIDAIGVVDTEQEIELEVATFAQPLSVNPCRTARTLSADCGSFSVIIIATTTRRIRSDGCARAASGHAATPLRSVMKSRRFS
jgi:prolyl-tRNA editing enzyme YbaK/EbsC (Cys-tRNA(Pro) deacylase)